jgi:hypothetical protein
MQYNPRETRRVLANCTDVIGRVHKELLQEQSCISKLAGQEHERRRAVEALLREASHGLPVFTIRCEYDAGSKVHSKRDRRLSITQVSNKGREGGGPTVSRP